MILSHPNGQRTRCTGHQLESLNGRVRVGKKSKKCLDCRNRFSRLIRSPRCGQCRQAYYKTNQNRRARERRAWAREQKPTSKPCVDCQGGIPMPALSPRCPTCRKARRTLRARAWDQAHPRGPRKASV